MGVEGLTTP